MHPLHEYVARQLAEKLKSKRLVVWYDARDRDPYWEWPGVPELIKITSPELEVCPKQTWFLIRLSWVISFEDHAQDISAGRQ